MAATARRVATVGGAATAQAASVTRRSESGVHGGEHGRGGARWAASLLALFLLAGTHLMMWHASHGAAQAASATAARAPTWVQLPAAQKEFLVPLEETWDSLGVQTRRKLVGIAQRQSKMTAEQRERVQSQLSEWSQLSVEERERARKNYQQLSKLPPDQRSDITRRLQEARQPMAPRAPEGGGDPNAPSPL